MKYNRLQADSYSDGDKYIKDALMAGKSVKQHFFDLEAEKKDSYFPFLDTKVSDFHDELFKDGLSGFYATNAFEVLDYTPNMPLSYFFHHIVMPKRYGGGLAEGTGGFRISLSLAQARLAGGADNIVHVPDTVHEKFAVPAYIVKLGLVLANVNWLKAQQINYDLLGMHVAALQLSYQREVEYFAFIGNLGLPKITSTSSTGFYGGLLNFPAADILGVRELESDPIIDGDKELKKWQDFDINNWVELFVQTITKMKLAVRQTPDKLPNMILLPPSVYELILKAGVVGKVSGVSGTGVAVSIFEYLQRQIEIRNNTEVVFVELPYIDIAANAKETTAQIVSNGTYGTGSIIFMRWDEKVIRQHIPMPLTGGAFAWSPTEDGYRQNYLSVIAPPLLIYPETIYRINNGETSYLPPTKTYKLSLTSNTVEAEDSEGKAFDDLNAIPRGTTVVLKPILSVTPPGQVVDTFKINGRDRVFVNDGQGALSYTFNIYTNTVVEVTVKANE